MSLQLSEIGGAQDFGDEFQFEEDSGALNSILNNQGVSRAQMQPPKTPNKISFTPAKVVPESFRNREDRFEFFENKGGQVFFRRKIIPGSEKKMVLSSAKKLGGCHERRLGNVTTHMVPQRMPMSARKRSPFGKSPVHRAGNKVASIMERRPLAPKNSNSTQIPNTRVLPPKFPGSLTERKQDIPRQPVTRQGLTEQKEKKAGGSGIPRPAMAENHARQSLYRKFDEGHGGGGGGGGGPQRQAPTFEPSLTRLTRDSFRLLPRESMAWLTQLPRDSATFAELEKMMTDNDRDCANDDDTMSFETLESRMRTPYKGSAKRMEDKENSPSNLSGIEPMMNNTLATPIANVEEKEQDSDIESKKVCDVENVDKEHPDDDEVNVSLRRSVSNIDLATEPDSAVPLARSSSLVSVAGVETMSPLVASSDLVTVLDSLDTYQEQLDRFKAEQDRLVTMEQEILARIRQRKTEFKSLWGVSPINIKTRRTIIKPLSPLKFNLDINAGSEQNVIDEVPVLDNEADQTPVKVPEIELNPPETEKRVRFNPSHNETRSMTPRQELEDTLDDTPVSSHGKRNTRNKSRKSFDSLKCSLAFLKTPQTAMRSQEPRRTPSAAQTPMALRHLSDRVMAEFAALYSDSSDDTDTNNSVLLLQNPKTRLTFDK